jgi:hypothetical protein
MKYGILFLLIVLCVSCGVRESEEPLKTEVYVYEPGTESMFTREQNFYNEYLELPTQIKLLEQLVSETLEKMVNIDSVLAEEGIEIDPNALYVYDPDDPEKPGLYEVDRQFKSKEAQLKNRKFVAAPKTPRKADLMGHLTKKREKFVVRADFLQEVLNEKVERKQMLADFFDNKYEMKPDRTYEFSATNSTIYEVVEREE